MRAAIWMGLGLLATSALAEPAVPSDDFAARIIGHKVDAEHNYACFLRVYDRAHLSRHPHQNVTQATLLLSVDPDDTRNTLFSFAFRVRGSLRAQVGNADCGVHTDEDGRSHIQCMVPCDGGQTGLVQVSGPDKARIVLTRQGLEDRDTAGPDADEIHLGQDDRVFDLVRAPLDACKTLLKEGGGY